MKSYVCFLLLFLLVGCVGPDYERPHIPVPPTWKNQPPLSEKDQKGMDVSWWRHFQDPELDSLIEEAAQGNLDYLTALARIREARASFEGIEANLYPTLEASGSANQQFYGTGVPTSVNPSGSKQNRKMNMYAAGFDAKWEIDIFGAVRRGEESARAILESVEDNARLALLSLMAEVAQSYITLRNYQNQLAAAKEIAALWQDKSRLQAALEKSGLANQVATSTTQASLNQALAAIPTLEANLKATVHHIAVLLGKEPGALYGRLLSHQKDIPHTSEAIVAGLPAEIIFRRPDVRAAERLLASATAQVGIAEAALFPQFHLTGAFNYQRNKASGLFRPADQFWQYGLAFSVPIFDFGKIRAQVEAKSAQKDEAFLTYQKSVLTALEDVENALVTYAKESNRYHFLQQQSASQKRACGLTGSRRQAGLDTDLDVIQAKITYLNGKLAAIQSQAMVSLNLVTLYKALGGGWEAFEKDHKTENSEGKKP